MNTGIVVAAMLSLLGALALVLHRRQPFEGGPRQLLRVMLGGGAAALLLIAAGEMTSTAPTAAAGVPLGGLAAWGVVALWGGSKRGAGPLHATTPHGGWRVVGATSTPTRAPLRGGYAGASATVRGIEAMEVQ